MQLEVKKRETIVDGDILDHATLSFTMVDQDMVYLNTDKPNVVVATIQAMNKNNVSWLIVVGVLGVYDKVFTK